MILRYETPKIQQILPILRSENPEILQILNSANPEVLRIMDMEKRKKGVGGRAVLATATQTRRGSGGFCLGWQRSPIRRRRVRSRIQDGGFG